MFFKYLKVGLAATAALLLGGAACAAPAFHVGIVTGTLSQSEDEIRGAEYCLKKYGDVSNGGMIRHVTYPDNFMSEMETTISQIVGLADDPLLKVIVINQGIPGTTEGIRRVKQKRPDIICLVGEAHEDPNVITSAADMATTIDFIDKGYLLAYTAKQMGADTFVHISFPRHMSYESIARRVAIIKAACQDLGLKFSYETAPDPTSDVGVVGAQQFMIEKVPAWIKKYGEKTVFFTTNYSLHEPLLRQLARYGGMYIEADSPSPLVGYPAAFSIDLSKEAGNWPAILKKVEDAVIKAGGSGRMGTWAYSYGYANTLALVDFGINVVEKKMKLSSKKDFLTCFDRATLGSKWNGNYYTDLGTGVTSKNLMLIYQDTYIFGKGFMGVADIKVPEKYRKIK